MSESLTSYVFSSYVRQVNNGVLHYITSDSFSRLIVGYNASKRLLTTQTTSPTLEMAIKYHIKQNHVLDGLIFHSDRGGKYYTKGFLEFIRKYDFQNSMCKAAWKNGKTERIKDAIKYNYLRHRAIIDFSDLKKEVDRSVYLFSKEKSRIGLQKKHQFNLKKLYL